MRKAYFKLVRALFEFLSLYTTNFTTLLKTFLNLDILPLFRSQRLLENYVAELKGLLNYPRGF